MKKNLCYCSEVEDPTCSVGIAAGFDATSYSHLATFDQTEITETLCGQALDPDPIGIYTNTYSLQNSGYIFERNTDGLQLAKNSALDRWEIATSPS